MNTFPRIETDRLILRGFKLSDSKDVQRLAGHPKVAETTATIPHPYLDGIAEQWISNHNDWFNKGQSIDFAIELKETQQLIGNISLMINKTHHRAEVGYWIGVEYWNNGYCTEALKQVIQYGFQTRNLNKITSRHMHTNPSSGKVMLKAGLKQEGVLQQDHFKDNQFYDLVVYGLLKKNWSCC